MTNEAEPGAAGTANRAGVDTPGQLQRHSMSMAPAPSSLVTRWKSAKAAAVDSRLSRVELSAHLIILDHMNNASGESWPSAETVARSIGASVRAVRKARGKLVALGHLTETIASGRPNRYRIGTPELQFTPELAFTPEQQDTPPLNCSSATPELQFRGPLNHSSPELALKHLIEEPTKEPVKQKISSASRPEESFIRFWNAYPRKDAKADAAKAWGQVKGSQSIELILVDLAKRTADPQQWTERQFIPMPATYLRKQRWLDEWTAAPPAKTAGRVSVPSADKAAEINARADAKLAKLRLVQ